MTSNSAIEKSGLDSSSIVSKSGNTRSVNTSGQIPFLASSARTATCASCSVEDIHKSRCCIVPSARDSGLNHRARLTKLNSALYSCNRGSGIEPRPTRLCEWVGPMELSTGGGELLLIWAKFDVSTSSTFRRCLVGNRENIANYLDQRNKTYTPRWRYRSGCPIRLSHSMLDR